jgi:hypothetical protein
MRGIIALQRAKIKCRRQIEIGRKAAERPGGSKGEISARIPPGVFGFGCIRVGFMINWL